jgi:hypothetical protein
MKIFFTTSRYDTPSIVEQNVQRVEQVFDNVIHLSVIGSVFETFELLKSLSTKEFIWIDGDNIVYDSAKEILDHSAPSIMMTENEYGIVYGHGGIKRCRDNVILPSLFQTIDVSQHARYVPIKTVGSFHHLGTGWIKIRTIFVEMTKLALRGDTGKYFLDQWKTARPDIWNTVEIFLHSNNNLNDVKRILNNRILFKEYYDSRLCGNLQE